MAKALVNGITIAYEDVGEGEDVLVLVHGHPFNRTMWRPQVDWIGNLNRARDFEAGLALPGLYHQTEPHPRDSQPARIEDEVDEDDYGGASMEGYRA
jgi:pimeloyl-ACP methyl ester carboxylesterase